MKIRYVRGCVNDWLGIDGKPEAHMTDERRLEYFDKIAKLMRGKGFCGGDISRWFSLFLQWLTEIFSDYYSCSEPCEQCGDVTETFELEMNEDGE